MSNTRNFIKFYPADHMDDKALALCSLAARGLWMELLCIMHSSPRYGYLLSERGRPLTQEQLAVLCKTDAATVKTLMNELSQNGVYSMTASGVPYSRRLIRDRKAYELGQQRVAVRWKRGENCEKTLKQQDVENKEEIGLCNSPPNKDAISYRSKETIETKNKKRKLIKEKKPPEPLPPDWQPTPENRLFAEKNDYSAQEIDIMAKKFVWYWTENKPTNRADWQKTWENWVLNQLKYSPPNAQKLKPEKVSEPDWAEQLRRKHEEPA